MDNLGEASVLWVKEFGGNMVASFDADYDADHYIAILAVVVHALAGEFDIPVEQVQARLNEMLVGPPPPSLHAMTSQ
jgi:hypothetical protein